MRACAELCEPFDRPPGVYCVFEAEIDRGDTAGLGVIIERDLGPLDDHAQAIIGDRRESPGF